MGGESGGARGKTRWHIAENRAARHGRIKRMSAQFVHSVSISRRFWLVVGDEHPVIRLANLMPSGGALMKTLQLPASCLPVCCKGGRERHLASRCLRLVYPHLWAHWVSGALADSLPHAADVVMGCANISRCAGDECSLCLPI